MIVTSQTWGQKIFFSTVKRLWSTKMCIYPKY